MVHPDNSQILLDEVSSSLFQESPLYARNATSNEIVLIIFKMVDKGFDFEFLVFLSISKETKFEHMEDLSLASGDKS